MPRYPAYFLNLNHDGTCPSDEEIAEAFTFGRSLAGSLEAEGDTIHDLQVTAEHGVLWFTIEHDDAAGNPGSSSYDEHGEAL